MTAGAAFLREIICMLMNNAVDIVFGCARAAVARRNRAAAGLR